MTFKEYWRKNRRGLLLLITIAGLLITAMGVLELMEQFGTIDMEIPLVMYIDNWAWFLVIIGGIVLVGGYLYYRDFNKNHKRFHELMDTESKATFVRNIVEIEELAVSLGPDYESDVIDKKRKLKIKTR